MPWLVRTKHEEVKDGEKLLLGKDRQTKSGNTAKHITAAESAESGDKTGNSLFKGEKWCRR